MTVPTKEELDAAVEADAITMAQEMAQTVELAMVIRGHTALNGLNIPGLVFGIKLGLRIGEARSEAAIEALLHTRRDAAAVEAIEEPS